jgi:hypothetical protein
MVAIIRGRMLFRRLKGHSRSNRLKIELLVLKSLSDTAFRSVTLRF